MNWLKNLLRKWLDIKPEYRWHVNIEKNEEYHREISKIKNNLFFMNLLDELYVGYTIECSTAKNNEELIRFKSGKEAVNLIRFKIAQSLEWLLNKQKEAEEEKQMKPFLSEDGEYEIPPIYQAPFFINNN